MSETYTESFHGAMEEKKREAVGAWRGLMKAGTFAVAFLALLGLSKGINSVTDSHTPSQTTATGTVEPTHTHHRHHRRPRHRHASATASGQENTALSGAGTCHHRGIAAAIFDIPCAGMKELGNHL